MAAKKRTKGTAKNTGGRSTASAPTRQAWSLTVRQGDKAAFVRGLPRSMAASEVVDRAATKGMIISKAYVHNIRSAANKAARALMAKEGKKTVKGNKKKLVVQFRELVVS